MTVGRRHMFGEIAGDQMRLNSAGRAVYQVWRELPIRFANIEIDEFVVMPNHVHGIVWLTESENVRRTPTAETVSHTGIDGLTGKGSVNPAPTVVDPGLAQPPDDRTDGASLGEVIGAFKSLSALAVNRLLRRSGTLWQPNYYEHIIRNDDDLMETRRYIIDNPARWALDPDYAR